MGYSVHLMISASSEAFLVALAAIKFGEGMETRDVLTVIALTFGPVIVVAFALWCVLEGWAS